MSKDKIVILNPVFYFILLMLLNVLPFNLIDVEGIFILCLLLLNPIMFFINGFFIARFKLNFLIYSGMSLFSYIIFAKVCLNSSAYVYMLGYIFCMLMGYTIGEKVIK